MMPGYSRRLSDTVLPDPKWDAWLLERRYSELYKP